MISKNSDKKLENIRTKINVLKQRLENIDRTLIVQEKMLDLLNENAKLLFKEESGIKPKTNSNIEEVMKKCFTKGVLPKILFK